MTRANLQLMSLDIGDKRVGVAMGESGVRIAVPYRTIDNDDKIITKLVDSINQSKIDILVVGRPIDQNGRATEQTTKTEEFVQKLVQVLEDHNISRGLELVSWGESGTSLIAEDFLKKSGKNYGKGDIDSAAAAVILQDFMESNEYNHLVKEVAKRKGQA